ncbi:TPM domain-containing protein [Erythrobacter litoralis]|uniref:TPM domain-containing protein n=1 Tax=Erythrobacter litoralis (strain HTCC2594) TaxID=314225 RepID=Q2N8W0_ERYLH|nr:TPM domain-containing protein [Erythrobacter litoralis]ABC63881.1 hypothetical protein ELI_08945 [Erythrobacter litoralis HTCC2594]
MTAVHSLLARLAFAIAALAAVVAGPVSAQDFPALSGRVVDAADILSNSEEAQLTANLAAVEEQNGRQFVVATIPDLQGYPIEDYGYRLGREWGIGDAERNDGILLIVAPNERKVRIEVGYGLEGVMTDALSKVIIERNIIPHFKADNLPRGIEAGSDAIIRQISLPEEEALAIASQAQSQGTGSRYEGLGTIAKIVLIFVLLALPWVFFILPMIIFAKLYPKRYKKWKKRRSRGGRIYSGGSRSYSSSSSFSGGGGSFGGGGASGSW